MSTPARYDEPGVSYDSGLYYGPSNPEPRTKIMNNVKVYVNLAGYTNADLLPVAKFIHAQMVKNAATFPGAPVAMADLLTQINNYSAKLTDRSDRASGAVLACKEARQVLEVSLNKLGNYINSLAQGDAIIVNQSGFPSYSTARTRDLSPPPAPTEVRLSHGAVSGNIVVRYKPGRAGLNSEVAVCTGDPNVEDSWKQMGIFTSGRAEISGLTAGAVVWVRVRTIGLNSTMGDWSDIGQIRVL